jgi:phenylacetate-CoA ligase
MLVGRVGEAVKVRGMFVHPNQLKAAAAKFPAIARVQAIVTRPDNVRDTLTLQVELAQADVDREKLSREFAEAVRGLIRVSVDQVEFVPAIAADAKMIVDERKWE